ncbi:MAG: aminotransferase class III-fold pyridoxal phosphate-dependent enzyme, partial [Desulfobacterales bacterium]
SFDGMGLEPDIICLAKGLGGYGTPLAMNLIKPEYDRHWQPGEHTGTFRGQGLSFVAGGEALSYFEDDGFMKDVQRKGRFMRDRLESLLSTDSVSEISVRGKGMLRGFDVADGNAASDIVDRCFERGLLIGACGTGGRVLKCIPPLTIPDEDLAEGLDIFAEAARTYV